MDSITSKIRKLRKEDVLDENKKRGKLFIFNLFSLKLRGKIILPVLIMMIVIIVVFEFIVFKIKRELFKESLYFASPFIISTIETNIKNFMRREDLDSIQVYISNIKEKHEIIKRIIVVDNNKDIISSTERESIGKNITERFREYQEFKSTQNSIYCECVESNENTIIVEIMVEKSEFLPPEKKGYLVIDFNTKNLSFMKRIETLIASISSVIIVLSFLFFSILFFIFRKYLIKPVLKTKQFLENIKKNDYTESVPDYLLRKDEIGEITIAINSTVSFIRNTIGQIKLIVTDLIDKNNALFYSYSSLENLISIIITEVKYIKEASGIQSREINESIVNIQNIKDSIKNLKNDFEYYMKIIESSFSSINEVIMDIENVKKSVIGSFNDFNFLKDLSTKGLESLNNDVKLHMMKIMEESKNLKEITKIIEDIAYKTNLLSMNAAIEAAHAGEYGKGFAVVAEEVRNLSDSVSSQTKSISEILKKMQNVLVELNISLESIGIKFTDMDKNIQGIILSYEKNVVDLINKVDKKNNEIKTSINNIISSSQEINDLIFNISNKNSSLIKITDALNKSREKVDYKIALVSELVEKISSMKVSFEDIFYKNKSTFNLLEKEISKVKIEK